MLLALKLRMVRRSHSGTVLERVRSTGPSWFVAAYGPFLIVVSMTCVPGTLSTTVVCAAA
jgi:hypothetical protein